MYLVFVYLLVCALVYVCTSFVCVYHSPYVRYLVCVYLLMCVYYFVCAPSCVCVSLVL